MRLQDVNGVTELMKALRDLTLPMYTRLKVVTLLTAAAACPGVAATIMGPDVLRQILAMVDRHSRELAGVNEGEPGSYREAC